MPLMPLADFRMHYVERGAGERVVVFVHGWLSSHRWWELVLNRLPSDIRAFALDWRGAGGSDPVEEGHTLAQYAMDLHRRPTKPQSV